MIIKLEKYEVTIKDSLTWGDKEAVKGVFIGGAKMNNGGLNGFNGEVVFQAKLKLMEKAVLKITEGDKVVPFTTEWAENLPVDDGDKLYEAIDNLDKKKS